MLLHLDIREEHLTEYLEFDMATIKLKKSSDSKKNIQRLVDLIENIDKKSLSVGFMKDRRYEDGTSVINVAYKQEFGGISSQTKSVVPPRPFIRPAVESNNDKWFKEWEYGIKNFLKTISNKSFARGSENYAKHLEQLGGVVVNDIKYAIQATISPPLALFTKIDRRRRGNLSDHPLIDTGKMIDSISYRIKTKNKTI